ncbi:MAG: DUF4783 domain-containing protein [Chitinophagaceae bacterium]|jgi:hypothetical protein|nr:DUF4783 domain-containing protein [Chitinophagaceae bacterium]
MKSLFTLLLFTVSFIFASFSTSQSGIDDIINALRSGNASGISRYIDENVEISLPDKSDNYSKAQAGIILKDFFNNNSIKSFELKHKGDQGGRQFCIGTLHTKTGSYRTTVFMKPKADKQVMGEIRFQPLN